MTLLMGVQNTSANISFQAENTESSAAHGYLMIQVSGIDIFLFHKDLIVEEYQMKSVVKFTWEKKKKEPNNLFDNSPPWNLYEHCEGLPLIIFALVKCSLVSILVPL